MIVTEKKIIPVFLSIIMAFEVLVVALYKIAFHEEYAQASAIQGTYTLSAGKTRGTIYDCNMNCLAGGNEENFIAVSPSLVDFDTLYSQLTVEEIGEITKRLGKKYPIAMKVNNSVSGDGILSFKLSSRYDDEILAVHTVGYLDSSGSKGMTGIERAFDDVLNSASGSYKIKYQIDAVGNALAGFSPEVSDTTFQSKAGVVLTIDSDIQRIAQNAADEYIESGAVIVMETHTGKIRAIVSKPDFSPSDIADVLDDESAPLINRALYNYDVGSVFKLITAAAALEAGISENTTFDCEGNLQIGENVFTCNNSTAHGELDMCDAICHSCNLYFINLAKEIGAERLLFTAKSFGIGTSIKLAENYESFEGKLPDEETLKQEAALANFSFGQGNLMATPLHIASLIGTIASNGIYIKPRLVEKVIDMNGNTVSTPETFESKMLINEKNTELLQIFMRSAVLRGTAAAGAPENTNAAAKTGTAETGITKDGKKVLQAWYAGFFPYEYPEYICVVLVENGISGGKSAGPVFKQIAENMYK